MSRLPAPRVSVLMPAYDARPTLGAALRSVQRQSEPDWECLVVDDGSTDGTGELAAAFARADPRIAVVRAPHRGLVDALATGLERCRAPLVARMDADDCMHPERLARQRRRLEAEPGLAAVGCGVRIFPRRSLAAGRLAYEAWLNRIVTPGDVQAEIFVECPIAHPALCIRTPVLRGFGYRDAGWPEDYDLVLRLHRAGLQLASLPELLLAWRDHPARLSRVDPRYRLDRFVACKAAHLRAHFLAGRERYVLWGYGPTARALARALAALGAHPERIVEVHPRRIGQRIRGVPVVAPGALGPPGGRRLVAAVAGLAARTEIRRDLAALGWRETEDFVCAA